MFSFMLESAQLITCSVASIHLATLRKKKSSSSSNSRLTDFITYQPYILFLIFFIEKYYEIMLKIIKKS